MDKSLVEIRETITGFVTRERARLAQNPELAEHPTNLLEAMLAAPHEGDAAFTDEQIYGNVLTMLLAGEDTTANTMAWMTHFMIEHPEAQARMQAEAGQVVGDAGMLTELADAERLKYIEAVTHETMRLKPVAPVLFLESNEDVEIGGVAVPKETAVFLLTLHAGLQDKHFGAADQFRPERWLEAAPVFRLSSQCEGVHSLWGGSAFLSGPSTGHGGDQDGHGHAVRRVRGLEDRTAPASRRDFFVHDDAGKSVRAFQSVAPQTALDATRRRDKSPFRLNGHSPFPKRRQAGTLQNPSREAGNRDFKRPFSSRGTVLPGS